MSEKVKPKDGSNSTPPRPKLKSLPSAELSKLLSVLNTLALFGSREPPDLLNKRQELFYKLCKHLSHFPHEATDEYITKIVELIQQEIDGYSELLRLINTGNKDKVESLVTSIGNFEVVVESLIGICNISNLKLQKLQLDLLH